MHPHTRIFVIAVVLGVAVVVSLALLACRFLPIIAELPFGAGWSGSSGPSTSTPGFIDCNGYSFASFCFKSPYAYCLAKNPVILDLDRCACISDPDGFYCEASNKCYSKPYETVKFADECLGLKQKVCSEVAARFEGNRMRVLSEWDSGSCAEGTFSSCAEFTPGADTPSLEQVFSYRAPANPDAHFICGGYPTIYYYLNSLCTDCGFEDRGLCRLVTTCSHFSKVCVLNGLCYEHEDFGSSIGSGGLEDWFNASMECYNLTSDELCMHYVAVLDNPSNYLVTPDWGKGVQVPAGEYPELHWAFPRLDNPYTRPRTTKDLCTSFKRHCGNYSIHTTEITTLQGCSDITPEIPTYSQSGLSPGAISSCGIINESGAYHLESDIQTSLGCAEDGARFPSGYPDTCLIINSSDVVLDCAGSTIEYSCVVGADTGLNHYVEVTGLRATGITNLTIRNCAFKGFLEADSISLDDVNNSRIESNSFAEGYFSDTLVLVRSNGNVITRNNFSKGDRVAIRIGSFCTNNEVSYNTISDARNGISFGTTAASGNRALGNTISKAEKGIICSGGPGFNVLSGNTYNLVVEDCVNCGECK